MKDWTNNDKKLLKEAKELNLKVAFVKLEEKK